MAMILVCAVAARWQFGRALSRHSILNWSYVLEWTLFAGFVVLCWGWFLRDELRAPDRVDIDAPAAPVYQPVAQPVSDEEDPELAAYNRYLVELNARQS